MSVITELVQSVVDMPGKFLDVVLNGPFPPSQALLIFFGAIFVALPSIALLYFTLGAGLDLATSGPPGATHPEE
jgi:hypothetical protein